MVCGISTVRDVMPYMYSEMQNKLSKTRESPLESMGQINSSRCP